MGGEGVLEEMTLEAVLERRIGTGRDEVERRKSTGNQGPEIAGCFQGTL